MPASGSAVEEVMPALGVCGLGSQEATAAFRRVCDNRVLWLATPPFTTDGRRQERLRGGHLPHLQKG